MRPGRRRRHAEPGFGPWAGQGAGPAAARRVSAGCRWSGVGFGRGSANGGSPGEPGGGGVGVVEQRRGKRAAVEEEAPWNAEGPGE